MKFGSVIATESELRVFCDRFRDANCGYSTFHGMETFRHIIHGHEVWTIQRGAGEIRAAAATQELIKAFRVGAILNFGVCGGLAEDIPLAEPLIVSNVIHYDYDVSAVDGCVPARYEQYPTIYIPANLRFVYTAADANPGIHRVTCASGDKFLARAEDKRNLRARFETAQICDMEAAGILLTANMWNVPALLIKAVSDGVTGGVEESHKTFSRAANSCLDALDNFLSKVKGDDLFESNWNCPQD